MSSGAKRATSALQQQAISLMRAELAVAIDNALAFAPRRYRIIQWFAIRTRRVPLVGRLLERLRLRSYDRRVKPIVTLARTTVEGRLPRRYRRALRGDAMAASVRR
jgi:hypothetical protein